MGPGTEAGTQELSHAISSGGVSQASTPSNRIAVYEDLRFAYDVHGNITERRIGWHTVQHLHYSAEHQLKSITVTRLHDKPTLKAVGQQETTPPAATTQTTHYRYDALGRRIDKTGSFGTTRFGWDGDLLALEIRGSKQSEYLYEPDSFVPLAKLESATHIQRPEHKAIHPKKVASLFKTAQTDSEQKEAPAHASQAQEAIESEASVEAVKEKVKDFSVYYYHCDQIGAPQELTDEQGHIVWAVDYKVWGRTSTLEVSATGTDNLDPYDLNRFWPGGPRDLKARSSSTTQALNEVEQNLRFQGQYFDSESGLHYNRFRYYDPQTGRFVHQDPIGLEGGLNCFMYAVNPFEWIDPVGLSKTKPKKKCGCSLPCITIDSARHPETAQHVQEAIAAGHPDELTIDRPGTKARRRASLKGIKTKPGKDRDEYPPAMFKEGGAGADVKHIDSCDNRGAGSCMGHQCAKYPNGTKVKIKVK